MNGLLSRTATALLLCLALIALPVASQAATLVRVTGFGSNPGALNMWAYVPDNLPPGSPAVVALHGCTQSASAYHTNSGWRKFADQHGFALIYPEATTAPTNCFQWFQEGDIRRGQGEALSIAQMVAYATSTYRLDPARISITGLSAGGAMTAVMIATYPELFHAASIVAGLPYRCSPPAATYTCMLGPVSKSPADWGSLVRAAYAGYTGPRPKVAIWQGQADYTVNKANGDELRDQFTNVLGLPTTPASTASLPGGTTMETYGTGALRYYKIAGMGHGTPVDPGGAADQCGTAGAYFLDTICSAYHDTRFFDLAGGTGPGPDPDPTPTPTPTPPLGCFTASNYAHTQAGRAHQSGGYAYANGSNQPMGLWNTFVITTLRQTGPNHYEVGTC
ncbi:extracellular catalytic domain type 1 short-chain-length polyhydroxyalkanoate depolymerase [Nonomuraea jiangxiensis]|uniref:Feruloyl esterase n=1 Tax=Nonomuraea jiangxiensis TaxID=633440 RepID=A0A1G8IAQ9_9ACTN|nr:PHB depolymerase family esterase [Nonomuraea jiangxiensis]SDI15650.1 feruloyl esterase [Nonomuraea jiangxiensis]